MGPVNWNLSRQGVGWSIGIPGARYGRTAIGTAYVSLGIPGSGVYWTKHFGQAPSQNVPGIPTSPAAVSATAQPVKTPLSINQKLLFWKKP
jgi:hypothetical protein